MDTRASSIVRQVASKLRAFAVIDSCNTGEQFDSAERYVENYYSLTEDYLGYQELLAHLRETRINSLYPQY